MIPNESILEGAIIFDPDDPIYKDHFPGNPIVPGNLIIHFFCEKISSTFNIRRELSLWPFTIKKFQFLHFSIPGHTYHYRVSQDELKYSCFLFDYQASDGSLKTEKMMAKGNVYLWKSSHN